MFPSKPSLTGMLSIALATPLAADAPPSTDDLARQLNELRERNAALAAKVERLERDRSGSDEAWLTEARAAEIRGVVEDSLADATTRTSLQSSGATGGWDKGFFLCSPDGNFRLTIRGQLQVRWAFNDRGLPAGVPDEGLGIGSAENWGFEIRRARLWLAGHVVDPSWQYEFQQAFDRRGGNSSGGTLENAWIRKELDAFGGEFSVRVGQFKPPFNKEELVGSMRLLAVERTLVNEVFTTKWAQGLELTQTWDSVRLAGYYGMRMRADNSVPTTGAGPSANLPDSLNTPTFTAPQVDFALAGRAEWKLAGTWRQADDQNSRPGEEPGLVFGVAGMAQNLRRIRAEETIAGTTFLNPSSMWGITADVNADLGGATLFAAGYFRQVSLVAPAAVRGGGTNDELLQWGFTIQAGLFLTDTIEPFARWEIGSTDTDRFRTASPLAEGVRADACNVITVGANWYPAGANQQALKVSADVGFSLVPIVDFAKGGAEWLPAILPEPGEDYAAGQVVLRAQLQLLF